MRQLAIEKYSEKDVEQIRKNSLGVKKLENIVEFESIKALPWNPFVEDEIHLEYIIVAPKFFYDSSQNYPYKAPNSELMKNGFSKKEKVHYHKIEPGYLEIVHIAPNNEKKVVLNLTFCKNEEIKEMYTQNYFCRVNRMTKTGEKIEIEDLINMYRNDRVNLNL